MTFEKSLWEKNLNNSLTGDKIDFFLWHYIDRKGENFVVIIQESLKEKGFLLS